MTPIPAVDASSWRQLKALRHDFFDYLAVAARQGPLVRLQPTPWTAIHLVTGPALIEEILVRHPERYRKSQMTRRLVARFLGEGLVLSEGERHRRDRGLLQPVFRSPRMAEFGPMLGLMARSAIREWPQDEAIDFGQEMTTLTLSSLMLTLFGMQESEDSFGVIPAMRVFADAIGSRFRSLPLPDWLPTPRHLAERRAIRQVDHAINAIIHARSLMQGGSDLVSRLLDAQDAEGGFSAQQVRDHLATLYFAGHETSAKLLTWAGALLAAYPAWQDELRKELLSAGQGRLPPVATIEALPLLDAFFCEVLRLYPPAWLFDRQTVAETSLGPFQLPVGTTLYLSPYLSQRSAEWHVQPESFDPGRFLGGVPAKPLAAYFPFGGGPRSCIGRAYAGTMVKATLAQILSSCELRPADQQGIPNPRPSATLEPSRPVRLIAAPLLGR